MSAPQTILSAVMAAAIRDRRVLSLTYVGAIEPQLFAPLALYVNADNRLMVDGYEINGQRVRWRELDLTVIFVTHDVDEGVYLSTRVVALSRAPATIAIDVPIATRSTPESTVESA